MIVRKLRPPDKKSHGKMVGVGIAALLLVAGAASGLALASAARVSAAGVSYSGLGMNGAVPPEKAAGVERYMAVATTDANTQVAAEPAFTPDPIPAHVLGAATPAPVPPSMLQIKNGWLVSDGYSLVAVYAGSAGSDSSQGRVAIVRQNLRAGTQTVRFISAGSTGALAIAHPPVGAAVETSGLTRSLSLQGADGQTLTLNLGTDTIKG